MDKNDMWDALMERYDISKQALDIVTSINGFSTETMEDVLYVATGLRSFDQDSDDEDSDDDSEIIFSLDHLAGDVWVSELHYRMSASSIGTEQELADAIGADSSNPDEFAGEELEKILEANGYFIHEGNVFK